MPFVMVSCAANYVSLRLPGFFCHPTLSYLILPSFDSVGGGKLCLGAQSGPKNMAVVTHMARRASVFPIARRNNAVVVTCRRGQKV